MAYQAPGAQTTCSWRGAALLVVARSALSFAGATGGCFLGERGDVLLSVDTGIIGLVLGASLGAMLPLRRGLGLPERVVAAVAGALLMLAVWIDGAKLAQEAYLAFGLATAICAALLAQVFSLVVYLAGRRGPPAR